MPISRPANELIVGGSPARVFLGSLKVKGHSDNLEISEVRLVLMIHPD
jgi:hypothetical protein